MLTSAHGPNEVLVASRHSARGSGGEGANRKNVPLGRVPLAPQYPFERPAGGVLQVPERQKKYCQFGGFAQPSNHRTALYSPAEVDAQRAAPRKESRTIGSGAFLVTFAAQQK